MSVLKELSAPDDLYDRDGYAWSQREAELLRQRRFSEVDWENVIEEIESVGKSERRVIVSAYRLIAMHLLKWQYQPERRSRSWWKTIHRERGTLAIEEKLNPSLGKKPEEQIAAAYPEARRDAAAETGLPLSAFPETCPYTVDQLRDRDFLPE